MATKMKAKLGKYWLEDMETNPRMNKIFYVAAVFDPRQKLMHVEKCFKAVYGEDRANEMVGDVKNSLDELFELYKKNVTTTLPPVSNTSPPRPPPTMMDRPDRRGHRSRGLNQLQVGEGRPTATISQIDLYLSESQHVMSAEEAKSFDILLWWSKNSPRLPIMSEIARDVLAIPISSVASECAFSTGGRVLSPFRSSLTCNMVEALICAQDWLKSSSFDKVLNDEEDVPEEEMEKEYDHVLVELGMSGRVAQNIDTNTVPRGDEMTTGTEMESACASHA